MGLVDRLVQDDATDGALELVEELAGGSLPAMLAGARSVAAAYDHDFTSGARFELQQEQGLFEHGEAAEGIAAFIEKRSPDFA